MPFAVKIYFSTFLFIRYCDGKTHVWQSIDRHNLSITSPVVAFVYAVESVVITGNEWLPCEFIDSDKNSCGFHRFVLFDLMICLLYIFEFDDWITLKGVRLTQKVRNQDRLPCL